MTCKDCIHYDVCVIVENSADNEDYNTEFGCTDFKDKSRFVELPCKLGDSIFYVHRNSKGNNSIFKVNVFGIVVNIYDDFKKIYLKIIYKNTDGYIDRATAIYGVNAFSSLEEAELKLKELSK